MGELVQSYHESQATEAQEAVLMNISENLAFELIGRREVALHVAKQQIAELAARVQRAEERARAAADERGGCSGDCCEPGAHSESPFEPATDD